MIRVGILEDDERASKLLKENLERFQREQGEMFNVTVFNSALSLLAAETSFDLLFFDIEMPGMNGFEAAERIRKRDERVCIIFTTNMVSYAPKGYEVEAMDFIVKPVEYGSFFMKMKRALQYIKTKLPRYISIRKDKKLLRYELGKLMWVETFTHTLIYHFVDCVIEARGKLVDLEDELSACGFARCNSCYLVNFAYVSVVDGLSVMLLDKTELRISRSKRKDFLNSFGAYLGGGRVK